MEEILLNPNVAYVLLWAGIILALLAVLSPGTGLLEISALICLGLAGYAVFNLTINYWALGIMLLGIFFFVLSIRYPKQLSYLALSIACMVVGSIFLFPEQDGNWWDPAVNPFLALVVSGLSAAFFWIVTRKVMETRQVIPTHDLSTIIGAKGEAKSLVHREGSVQVGSELWSATSEDPIPNGEEVKVVGLDGFTLQVVPWEDGDERSAAIEDDSANPSED